MFNPHGGDIIGVPHRSVIIHPVFGNYIKPNSRRTHGSSFGPCQHQVDGVFTRTLIAGGDEHLGSLDFPNAGIMGRVGTGHDIPCVGAEIGFGQAHRSLPVSSEHF
jgi:hypothetical protein